jgi:hypothetical protein
MICGGAEGEMVDTGVDIPGDGRMYICVRWCAPRIGALTTGHYSPPESRCSETKANGQPCTAKALPGREVCVAHLRVQQMKEEEKDADVLAV